MTAKIFTLTIDQIKDIFRAGISRGSEEEASYQCGSSPCGNQFDELVNVLYDVVNEGKEWGEEGHTDFETIESWLR